jgi:hypothetical protein
LNGIFSTEKSVSHEILWFQPGLLQKKKHKPNQ